MSQENLSKRFTHMSLLSYIDWLESSSAVHIVIHQIYVHIPVYLEIFLGRVAQSVTCLATDVSLTADPGVASSIPARSHTFMEIDHEIISTFILLPYAESFKKGCCQLQAKVCA